jgi:hypothetical protein
MDVTLIGIYNFQVRHPRCVSIVQLLRYKMSRIQYNTTFTSFRYNCTIETQREYLTWIKELSVASQGVCFMRIFCVPSRQTDANELQRKIWVYKMSSNLNVLTRFYCTLQLYTHIQNCWMIWSMHSVLSCYCLMFKSC